MHGVFFVWCGFCVFLVVGFFFLSFFFFLGGDGTGRVLFLFCEGKLWEEVYCLTLVYVGVRLCGGICMDSEDSAMGIWGDVYISVSTVRSMLMAVLYACGLMMRD